MMTGLLPIVILISRPENRIKIKPSASGTEQPLRVSGTVPRTVFRRIGEVSLPLMSLARARLWLRPRTAINLAPFLSVSINLTRSTGSMGPLPARKERLLSAPHNSLSVCSFHNLSTGKNFVNRYLFIVYFKLKN